MVDGVNFTQCVCTEYCASWMLSIPFCYELLPKHMGLYRITGFHKDLHVITSLTTLSTYIYTYMHRIYVPAMCQPQGCRSKLGSNKVKFYGQLLVSFVNRLEISTVAEGTWLSKAVYGRVVWWHNLQENFEDQLSSDLIWYSRLIQLIGNNHLHIAIYSYTCSHKL